MPTRRDLLRLAALAGAGATLPACGATGYDDAVAATWRHAAQAPGEPVALLRELVRYATLAASSHNTQPWRFALDAGAITIQADLSRRTPAVDPDDHHLWVSLGCAAENLVQRRRGKGTHVTYQYTPKPVQAPLMGMLQEIESMARQAEEFMEREAATVIELATSTEDKRERVKAALAVLAEAEFVAHRPSALASNRPPWRRRSFTTAAMTSSLKRASPRLRTCSRPSLPMRLISLGMPRLAR